MNRNVEVKARLRGEEQLQHILSRICTKSPERVRQRDTFFSVPRGRLKLRETDSACELIYYDRSDQSEPAVSEYIILPLEDGETHRHLLEASLGIRGVVSKNRMVYHLDQTRIHIDEVDGLGLFIELEVVLTPGQSISEGEKEASRIMNLLNIRPEDLLPGAYIDLLENRPTDCFG